MQVQSDYDVQVNWDGLEWEPDDGGDEWLSVPLVGSFDEHWMSEIELLTGWRAADPETGRLYLVLGLAPADEDQTAEWRAEVEQLVAETNWRATRLRR